MGRQPTNTRWLKNPARRVKPDYLLHVMRATMAQNHAVASPVSADAPEAHPVKAHDDIPPAAD